MENLSSFVVKHGVPVLDAHELLLPDGNKIVIDEEFLRDVAKRCKNRERSGDFCPLVIGHTRDDGEEKPVVGFATNWRVNKFHDRPALFVDFLVFKHKKEVLNEYPRRSVELWLDRKEIDPIALLGGSSPARDLGLTVFSRNSSKVYKYQIEKETQTKGDSSSMNEEKLAANVVRLLNESDLFMRIGSLLEALLEAINSPQEQGQNTTSQEDKSEETKSEESTAPEEEEEEEEEEEVEEEDAEKEALKKKVVTLQREKALNTLRMEGVDLDVNEELSIVENFDDATFSRYLHHIKKRYSRKPAVSPAVSASIIGSSKLSQEDVNSIVEYATQNNVSYEQAKRVLFGK